MFLTSAIRAGLAAGLFFLLIPLVWADDYTRTANGSFSSTDWYDNTNNMPPPQGPPGGGDTAALNDWDVTASGGSVMTLGGGGSLTVTGSFTAMTAGGFTLKGLGTCNATTSSFINVDGGRLSTENDAGKDIMVLDGGSETATAIAAATQGDVSSNGSLVVKSQTTDLNLTLQTGGTADITDIQNGMSVSVSVDGTGSALTVDQDFDVAGGFLDLTGGGALIVSEDLVLDGIGNVGGGGHWSGPMTKVTLGGTAVVGDIAPAPGFALGIDSGTVVDSGTAFIGSSAGSVGNVTLDGTGTLWEVQTTAMAIGQSGNGTVNMTAGAHLLIDSGAVLGVGVNGGSKGTLTADGAGTLIDASKSAGVSIGKFAGANGSATLTNGASFMGGVAFNVGDTGAGTLTARSGSKITETAAVDVIVGFNAGSSGDFEVQDVGSSLTLPKALVVGQDGNGFFSVGFGGAVNFAADQNTHLVIANGDNSTGEFEVLGTTLVDSGPELIGGSGKATFSTGFGASLTTAFVTAPRGEAGQAMITVDSSTWVNTVNFYLGGLATTDPASTLILQNNSTMRVNDRMTIFPAGFLTIDNTSMMAVGSGGFGPAGSVRVSAGGILSGAGHVTGKVIEAGGEVFPGNSPGILTIDGDYEQDAGSTYSAEIGGITAGSGFDQIKVTGAATLGGTLQVQLVRGFTPTVGQTFQLLSAASKSGSFATITPPSQAGIALTTDATGVTVKITSVISGAPVINSPTTIHAANGEAFSYQINATNNPTSFDATSLPAGLKLDSVTGYITGTPTAVGNSVVPITATNPAGSGTANLLVVADPAASGVGLAASKLLNISTRLNVQTGDNVLIGGFIITGTAAKKVVLRGIGPSLTTAGVAGALADPVIELHEPDGTVITNDNWQDTQKQEIIDTGIPPTNPLESAIVATLTPDAYTVILRGNGGTGVGLIEAYDIDATADSQLANISTRGLVQTDDQVMIGGFIVGGGGDGNSTVVVRALGPSLGVSGLLADPTLELHDPNGEIIGYDNDWKDAQESEIKAAQLAPADDHESAIEATLAPGGYTAIVRGANNTTGVALVEAYNLQ